MPINLFSYRSDLQKKGVFFGFSGPLTQDLLVEMGDILKQKMKGRKASSPTILKVFSMVVEQSQNIIHYSAEKAKKFPYEEQDLSTGMIAVGYEEGEYFVTCGNLVENSEVQRLAQMLDQLGEMDKGQLKEFYKLQRRKDPDQRSKGAGLGFIEMARKASRPIRYEFEPVDEKYTFFSVNAHV